MNKQTEALKMDLENLIDRFNEGWHEGIEIDASDIMLLTNLREALTDKSQEPVAVIEVTNHHGKYKTARVILLDKGVGLPHDTFLYTHPATWQSLSDGR